MTSLKIGRKTSQLSVLVCLLFFSLMTYASVSTWTLSGVAFIDGGTATGSFDYDPDTDTLSNWSVTVSGGDTGDFPVFTWDPGNSTGDTSDQGDPQEMINFYTATPRRDMRITPNGPLTDAGGTIAINLNSWGDGSGSMDCFNCSPYRKITAGSLQSPGKQMESIPTLGGQALVGLILVLSLVGLGFIYRRRTT